MIRNLLFGLLFISHVAFAGKEVGNGGGAWICRESDQSIRWLEIMDLFEATHEFGLQLTVSQDTALNQNAKVMEEINNSRASESFKRVVKKYVRVNEHNIRWVSNSGLQHIDDTLYRVQPSPSSCAGGFVAYEQLANYTNYGAILIDPDLYGKLSETQKAALKMHEAVYAAFREIDGDTDSLKTQKIVAYLFSTTSIYEYDDLLKFSTTGGVNDICDFCAIDFEADDAGPFSGGIARVQKNGRTGFIDSFGQIAIPFEFRSASDFTSGIALADRGYIDTQGNRLFGYPAGTNEHSFINFDGKFGLFINCMETGGFGDICLMDRTGKVLWKLYSKKWETQMFVKSLSDGMIAFSRQKGDKTFPPGLFGYLDLSGNEVIANNFDDASAFRDGIARVIDNGKIKFIDHHGVELPLSDDTEASRERKFLSTLEIVRPFQRWLWPIEATAKYYDFRDPASDPHPSFGEFFIDATDRKFEIIGSFSDGWAPIYESSKNRQGATDSEQGWNFVNSQGQLMSVQRYEEVRPFSEGFAPVRTKDSSFGYINSQGELVATGFTEAYPITGGYGLVRVGKRWGYVSSEDLKVNPPIPKFNN